ncbi:4-hydroxy-tetrahydrodipicolinate reductase [soil metagenome]
MKIVLIGYGKMGKAIEQIALLRGHEVVLKITEENLADFTKVNLMKANVAIEFTQPESAFENILKCFDAGIPVVSGTTGWNQKLEEAKKICLQSGQSFFQAPNFSIGVNLFFALNELMAKMAERFPEYEKVSISETHHIQKKDAPSGTAVSLANDLLKHLPRFRKWESYPAESSRKTDPDEHTILPVHSHRIGDAAGLHEVTFESADDSIKLIHDAKGRTGFAKGAVTAAEWLIGKKGVFGMKDLLQL